MDVDDCIGIGIGDGGVCRFLLTSTEGGASMSTTTGAKGKYPFHCLSAAGTGDSRAASRRA